MVLPEATDQPDMVRRIQTRYGRLRPAERKVADHLRDHWGERLDSSITEFAKMLGVSEATISRVSRSLGYAGFPDMKLSVAAGSTTKGAFANIPNQIDEAEPLIESTRKLASALAESLVETQKRLDVDRLENAVDLLHAARRLTFIGVGGAAAICDEAAHLFLKAGKDATSYRDGYTHIIVAANMTQSDVMIGVSHTGETQTVAKALALARSRGARTISITSEANSDVAVASDLALITWHHASPQIPLYGDFLEGRMSQLFLINALYLGLLFKSGDPAREQLAATTKALEDHYRGPHAIP
ncbi:MAG: MurR/RpiR family transcriptional regulator [Bauldia sp.]|nr:MurR/RpiR family transcriptional regulator [Bauldia sp.]